MQYIVTNRLTRWAEAYIRLTFRIATAIEQPEVIVLVQLRSKELHIDAKPTRP